MRMIVAGGGTGGHLFPGLAVAEAAAACGNSVLFVGSSSGIEARIIPRTHFPFRQISIRGLRGRGWRGVGQLLVQLPPALARAWRIVREFRTEVVLGVGGYASFPVVLAAWLDGVPSVLMEQNARPGWTNRLLARLAKRVCTTFPDSAVYFPPGKAVQTGNPVRSLSAAPAARSEGFTLLVFGGSQGAHRINQALHDAAGALRERVPSLRILHQTGAADAAWLRERYAAVGLDAEVRDFIDDMGAAYAAADLVVCRAGATTVAEITALGKPAVLVPYPYAADDHQRANAAVLAERGAAVLVLDRDLDGARLASTVVELAADRDRLARMATEARRLGVPDAAERVLGICREVCGEVRGEVEVDG
jgi:UDP-N-acetylglucosamine--N-acetylmuramyl-(pentapeptide) pyrophosphoryl-undecaprenol N-acetylglucosamine transferase